MWLVFRQLLFEFVFVVMLVGEGVGSVVPVGQYISIGGNDSIFQTLHAPLCKEGFDLVG